MAATCTRVLRESDTAVAREVRHFNLANRGFKQSAEFLALLFRNGRSKVLDFRLTLSYKSN